MNAPATSAAAAIRTSDLRVDYGDFTAVHGLDLEVPAGEVYGLIGPNGAGKTSTFKVLATLMEPTHGDVFLGGIDVAVDPAGARLGLGYMPDLAPVARDLKVWEFLDMFAASYGLRGAGRRDRIEECLGEVDLLEKRTAYCKSLSRGMMQRLVLAKTILHCPKVLILDEPASGMDPVSRAALRRTLRALTAEGSTVVVSSHILSELSDMCTSVGIMARGRLLASGPVAKVVRELRGAAGQVTAEFTTSDAAANATSFLESKCGIDGISTERERVTFPFHGEPADRAELISKLVAKGLPLAALEVREGSIEDVILALSNDAVTAAKGGAKTEPS